MPQPYFTLLKEFSMEIHQFLLLNTIKQNPQGVAFSEFKEMPTEGIEAEGKENKPPTFIYRLLRRLEQDGCLRRQEEHGNESGRPKQRFLLTSKGIQKLLELQSSLKKIFEDIQTHFPEKTQNFSIGEFLEKGTLEPFESPVDHIMHENISSINKQKKLIYFEKRLTEMMKMLRTELDKIRAYQQQLEVSR